MAARPSGNRRALGDIGNIVGALSATYLVTKPQQQQQQKFSAEITLKNQVNNGRAEDDSKNGRKASSSTKKRIRIPDIDGHERMPVDGMEEEEEEHEKENARKKKLERRECATAIDSSVSTETTQPCQDGKGHLHV